MTCRWRVSKCEEEKLTLYEFFSTASLKYSHKSVQEGGEEEALELCDTGDKEILKTFCKYIYS